MHLVDLDEEASVTMNSIITKEALEMKGFESYEEVLKLVRVEEYRSADIDEIVCKIEQGEQADSIEQTKLLGREWVIKTCLKSITYQEHW